MAAAYVEPGFGQFQTSKRAEGDIGADCRVSAADMLPPCFGQHHQGGD
jgi:hypothetical protein